MFEKIIMWITFLAIAVAIVLALIGWIIDDLSYVVWAFGASTVGWPY